ncbi:maleylacetate reductase [Kordiimonas aquimaris]|uniref:maleylacetate reductase n=1 Tax=Kordiimonas aquimaris TaxID=707591 RepID=UPI0021D13968|nr:maleylacetate reductase [Kordiimonas aquimaris]
MIEFEYQTLPWNIVFGAGALARLPGELDKLGMKRALVLTTPNQTDSGETVLDLLDDRAAGLFDQCVMHVPQQTVTAASVRARELGADCTVALGGGSTTGLGKALAVQMNLPNIVIPTSYAGSEMTNIWAITDEGRKVTARDNEAVPTLTLYDPELTLTLPPKFAAASGLNAMAQAVVNIATDKVNPIVSCLAVDAVRSLYESLPVIMDKPDDMEARSKALYGACLAGGALGTGATSLHHKICHTMGGTFNMPHAETHAVILPHSVAYNTAATPEGSARLAEAMRANNAADAIYDLMKKLGLPLGLKDLGFSEAEIDKAAEITLENSFHNAEPVSFERLRTLLQNAYEGVPPQAIT